MPLTEVCLEQGMLGLFGPELMKVNGWRRGNSRGSSAGTLVLGPGC